MKYNRVYIESFAYSLPEKVLTTEEIENRLAPLYERLNLPFGRLEMLSGIKERRYPENGTMPSDSSTKAALIALEKTPHVSKDDIGCILHTSVSRDFLEPASANIVHNALGLSNDCTIYDISNACLGFLNGIITVADKIELGQIDAGMVVSGENGRPLLDTTIEKLLTDTNLNRRNIKEYFAALTIGSGAAAVILTSDKLTQNGHKLLGGTVQNATEHNELCRSFPDMGVHSGHDIIMTTDSEAVLINGCKLAGRTWSKLKEELGWQDDTPDRLFCHQVGTSHRRMLYETLGLDETRDFSTVEFLGNIGSVSVPITVAMGEEKGIIKKDDTIGLFGIGSGLNCIMLGVSW